MAPERSGMQLMAIKEVVSMSDKVLIVIDVHRGNQLERELKSQVEPWIQENGKIIADVFSLSDDIVAQHDKIVNDEPWPVATPVDGMRSMPEKFSPLPGFALRPPVGLKTCDIS